MNMFPEIWINKTSSSHNSCKISDDNEQGLKILTKTAHPNSKVLNKPIFLPTKSDCCYLKSCHLCHKNLPLDKEIYMYRGDLGFCSVECRDNQIHLDETKEMELSRQRIFSSLRRHRSRDCHHFSSSGNRDVLLELGMF